MKVKVEVYGPAREGFWLAEIRGGLVSAWVQWHWPVPFEVGVSVQVVDEHRQFRPYAWINLGWLSFGCGWARW